METRLPSAKNRRAPAKLTISKVTWRRYQASKAATSTMLWSSEAAASALNASTVCVIPANCSERGDGPATSRCDEHLATSWRHTAAAATMHDVGMTSSRVRTWPHRRSSALLQRTCRFFCQSYTIDFQHTHTHTHTHTRTVSSHHNWCSQEFKWFTWHDHAPFRDDLSSVGYDLLRSTFLPNLKSLSLSTTKIWKAIQN